MRTSVRAVGLALLVSLTPALLVACGGTSAPSSTPPTAPKTTSIGPSGGTLTSADGVVTLTVPKGALSTTVTLGIAPATKAPAGAVVAYDLTPSGTAFAVPATLTVDTSALTLPQGTTEADVRIESASGGAWKGLYTALDGGKHTASVALAHLSTYGVLTVPLSSKLVMAWVAGDPMASVYVEDATSGVQQQATVAQPVAGEGPPASATAPVVPGCFMWTWVNQRTYHDVSGVHEWSVSASYPSSNIVASAGDDLAVAGSGTDFSVTSAVQGSAGPGSAQAGSFNGGATAVYPFIIATIDNPSGAPRTLTLVWTSHASYNGTSGSDYGGGAGIEIDYVDAKGGCLGGAYPNVAVATPNTTTTKTLSYSVPAGAVTIWVRVEKAATVDLPLNLYRTSDLVAKVNEELRVQLE